MSALCLRCEVIFEAAERAFSNSNSFEWINGYFGEYMKWQHNAQPFGCHLCCILFSLRREDAIAELKSHGAEDGLVFYFDLLKKLGCLVLSLVNPQYRHIIVLRSGVRFAKSAGSSNLTPQATSLTNIRTWSDESPDLVWSWLSECSEHEKCRPRRQRQRLPLRLIDVHRIEICRVKMQTSEGADPSPRCGIKGATICSTGQLPLETQYLTLSHCWGGNLKIKLSNTNFAEYTDSQGIPPHVFADPSAATFRDAIFVTQSLGFPYLWIDSLCINQEDNEEKQSEIMFMHEIYRHAEVNISATAAADGFGGLLQNRDPHILYPCTCSQRPGLVAFTDPLIHFTPEVLQGPVNRRSWVFQERMLARRVLHFCSTQIFWECFEHQRSESTSHAPSGSHLSQATKTKGELSPNEDHESLSIGSAISTWSNIAEVYSRTAISYPQDRLPALSALARVMWERRRQDMSEYAAGMWTSDLSLNLLWRVSSSARDMLMVYLAPTWSWVSVFRDIDFAERGAPVKTCFASVVGVSTTLGPGNDPFGKVEGGYLDLRCPLRPINFQDKLNVFTVGRNTPVAITVIASTFPGSVRDNLPDKKYVTRVKRCYLRLYRHRGRTHHHLKSTTH